MGRHLSLEQHPPPISADEPLPGVGQFDLLDRLAEAVSIIGSDGVHLHTNPAASAILEDLAARHDGRALAEVAWGSVDATGAPLPNERLPAEITRLTGEGCTEVEVGFPDAAGDVRWLRISSRRLSDEGPPFPIIISFVDVTAARRTQAELDLHRLRYQTVVEALHEGVVVQDENGRIVASNPRAGEVLGLSQDQLMGLTSIDARWEAVRPDGSPMSGEDHPASQVFATGRAQLDVAMGVRTTAGELRWLKVNAVPLHDAAASLTGVVATFADETDTLRARDELARATRLFTTSFSDAPIGMALVHPDGTWLKVNRALCSLTGYAEDELLACRFQDITHPDDLDADLKQLDRLLAGEIDRYSLDKRYRTASGELLWVNLNVSLVCSLDGAPEHLIAQIKDITPRKRAEATLQRLADEDPLTGLWNRRRFEEELENQAGRCRRYGEEAALLLLDLDDFKQVNDSFGHNAGDELLRSVARTMRDRLRETDSVARIGGDEFAVLLPSLPPEQVRKLADSLASQIKSTSVRVDGREIFVGVSVGVASFGADVRTGDAALQAADVSMYAAKIARAPDSVSRS